MWTRISALLLLLSVAGCGGEEPPPPAARVPEGNPLLLVVHPYDTPSEIVERFAPLTRYLTERLRRPVTLQVALTYGEQIRRIRAGEAHLAYMGPAPYLRAREPYRLKGEAGPRVLAAEVVSGEVGYRTVLVARRDSEVRAVGDLRGRTVAFGSPRSFSSHYVPRIMLLRHGIDLAALRDYAFLGRHERVALAVLHGDFDAGGIRREIAWRYMGQSPGLRILEESPLLPPHVIVAAPNLPEPVAAAVRDALLDAVNAAGFRFRPFGTEVAFAPIEPERFELARQVVQRIEADCNEGSE